MLAVKILFPRLLELRSRVAKLMDFLVSYCWNHFSRARREVVYVLRKFGDSTPQVERTGVIGIAIVHTSLNNREALRRCKELFRTGFVFRFAIKWVPADFWCETSLDAIKKVIDDNISGAIGENETWGMKVEKRSWQKYHTIQTIEHLAAGVNRKVNLSSPDKLIRADATQVLAVADAERRKLGHDPTELASRAIQPALWLVLFGKVMAQGRGLSGGTHYRAGIVDYLQLSTSADRGLPISAD